MARQAKQVETSKRWTNRVVELKEPGASVPDAFKADAPGGLSVPASTPVEVVDGDLDNLNPDTLSELAEKAQAFSESLRSQTSSAFVGLTSTDLAGLISGEISIQALVDEYGLTDTSSFAEEMSAIAQLANSINLSISKKGVQVLALKDRQASFEVVGQAAKTATAATKAADAIDESRHTAKMSGLASDIRRKLEIKKEAKLTIHTDQARKQVDKAGIAKAMQQRRQQRKGDTGNA